MSPNNPGMASPANDATTDGEGESLLTVLPTVEDRSSLISLVATCVETMRQSFVNGFDASQTGHHDGSIGVVEEDPESSNTAKPRTSGDNTADDVISKELEDRAKQLNLPKMQELKAAGLDHFDGWSGSVLQRIGGAVNSRETSDTNGSQTKQADSAIEHNDPTREQDHRTVMDLSDASPYNDQVQRTVQALYPATDTPLKHYTDGRRRLILQSMLLLLLSLEHYQAHSRILMLHLLTSLDLPIDALTSDETKIAEGLLNAAESMNADAENQKRGEGSSSSRTWKVGLAAVAGAALIGVTGGLAAPLLAAGLGSVMGGLGLGATATAGYLGTLAGSSVLVGSLFGAYGGRMTGKMMDKYAKDVQDFAFVPVRLPSILPTSNKDVHRLRVAIGISGWLTKQSDISDPWSVLGPGRETFALRWELEALTNLGNAMTTMVRSAAWSLAKTEIIKRTVFVSLAAGLWPLGLLKVSRVLENPYSVAVYRASKAGDALADALINKAQGERPVTLIGYSLGAKVIYSCLLRLAERRAFGLIESVVLMGTPAPTTVPEWRMIRSMVAGRVINVFSPNDYILAFLHRGHSGQYGVAGLQPINEIKGIENLDVSNIFTGHTSYRFLAGTILNKLGFEDLNLREIEKEAQRRKEESVQEDIDRQESEQKEKQRSGIDADDVSDEHLKDIESDIALKNQQSYLDWTQEKMKSVGSNTASAYGWAKNQLLSRWQQLDENDSSVTDEETKTTGSTAKAESASNAHSL